MMSAMRGSVGRRALAVALVSGTLLWAIGAWAAVPTPCWTR